MIVLSLFNGHSGGMIALEEAEIKVDKHYSSEIDKYANEITQILYPETIQLGDITKWREWDIEKPDLIMAGFPCQPYSTAGNRKGLSDRRGGNIVDSMMGVIEKYQPEDLMLENVTGLLSVDSGKTFKQILKQLNNIGYAVDWEIINSSKVSAQNRHRVYIFGKRLDKCQGKEYNIFVNPDNKRTKQLSIFGGNYAT